jgi:hypothetical protein
MGATEACSLDLGFVLCLWGVGASLLAESSTASIASAVITRPALWVHGSDVRPAFSNSFRISSSILQDLKLFRINTCRKNNPVSPHWLPRTTGRSFSHRVRWRRRRAGLESGFIPRGCHPERRSARDLLFFPVAPSSLESALTRSVSRKSCTISRSETKKFKPPEISTYRKWREGGTTRGCAPSHLALRRRPSARWRFAPHSVTVGLVHVNGG